MILIVILAFSVLLTIIGGVSGVFIFGKTEKTNKKDRSFFFRRMP